MDAMSAQPYESARHQPQKDSAAIRAALLPEDIDDFDADFHRVMAEVTKTYDLTPLHSFLQRWWPVALSSQDPDAHRRMLETARKLNAGEYVHTEPWDVTRKRLGF